MPEWIKGFSSIASGAGSEQRWNPDPRRMALCDL